MPDIEEVIKAFDEAKELVWTEDDQFTMGYNNGLETGKNIALDLLKEQEKEIKSLRLLVEWATDCDFGFDQFHDEYERYKDEIKGMKYIDGMIHVAKRTLEDHGAFAEGR